MAGRIPTKEEIAAAIRDYLAKNPTINCKTQTAEDIDAGIFHLVDANSKEATVGPGWKCDVPAVREELSEILMAQRESIGLPEVARGAKMAEPHQEQVHNPEPTPKSAVGPVTKPLRTMNGFRPAQRRKAKLRLGITGPAGSGKTMSALLIAGGLVGGDYSKIGLVDTENGSGDLYVHSTASGSEIGEYNVLSLEPPFEARKYIDAIHLAEDAGLEVIILDSITHAWAGEGGFLEKQGKIADKSGNSWAAWRTVTPEHNRFIDAMLQSKIHVIATMRSKTEHVYEGGRVKKVGMAPVAREGMEYEFSVVFDMDQGHNATPTKDRTSQFDSQIFKPSPDTGKMLLKWLEVA